MIPTLNSVTAGQGLGLAEFAQLAKRNGFIGIEFSIEAVADLVQRTSFEDVAAIFEATVILPTVFGLPVEWRQDEATFQTELAQLPALAKLAQDLDCSRCVTWVLPDSGEPVVEYATRSTRRFQEIGHVLANEGVRLGLEFLGPQHFRRNPDNVWFYDIAGALHAVDRIVGPAQLENVGLLVDSWHWYTSGGTPMDLASIPLEMFVHVHINDAPQVPRDEQVDSVRLLPGETGVIDLVAFLKTLNALGYDGPLAVETFSKALSALPPDTAAAQAGAAIAGVMQQAGVRPVRLL